MADMDPEAIEAMLVRAAKMGANQALERVGLHDEQALKDVHDLRDLLDMWRQVRTGALRTLGKMVMYAVLVVVAALAGKHYWPGGN